MDFLPNEKIGCHHTGFEKNCRDLVTSGRCQKWIQLHGMDRTTNKPIDTWGCVDALVHHLMIDNTYKQHETAAEIAALRKDIEVRTNQPRISDEQINKYIEAPQ